MSAAKIAIIILVIAVLGALGWYAYNRSPKPFSNYSPTTPVSSPAAGQIPTTVVTSPEPSPIKVSKLTGQIVSINGTSLVVSVDGKDQTVSLVGALSFEKITSGSIQSGNATLAEAKITDLKAGQTVLITFDEKTNKPRTVFITK